MSHKSMKTIKKAPRNDLQAEWRAASLWGARMGYLRVYSESAKADVYREWLMMLSRCYNAEDPGYPFEGARGVRVCDRWNPAKGGSFEKFQNDLPLRF